MAAKIFRINYKSDFILTLNSDAGWMTPFCIKFWTGAPSQAFFAQWDGETYTHCAPVAGEPTKLLVQFDDHHLPIGELKYQIAYHFTVADFPNDTEDEVLNQANITTEIDGETYQVMLDFTGETAPEIEFSLPAYANEAQRIANEQQRIANEQQRIANEESRIAAETIRQQNEQQRIDHETARVNEFATLKSQSQAATRDANDAATLANQKAQLAADKAALADDAATLANQKAQLAADKAALANDAAQLAADKAALAQQKAEYAQQQGSYAKDQGDYAKNQGNYAKEQGEIAQADHQRAEEDHGIAVDDHTRAGNDHTRAESDHGIAADDHTQAGNDHTRAESDHGIAADDHTQAGNDHTRAESDHGIAADDHTQAGNDHTRAESDHTRAESDHAAVEVYVDSLGVFDLSKHNAVGGVLATYADLDAALTALNALDSQYKYGGMSFKFVCSSDNKYVQARCMAQDFTTDVAQWQEVEENPTFESINLIESGGVVKYVCKKIELQNTFEIGGINGLDSNSWTYVNVPSILRTKQNTYLNLNVGDIIHCSDYSTIKMYIGCKDDYTKGTQGWITHDFEIQYKGEYVINTGYIVGGDVTVEELGSKFVLMKKPDEAAYLRVDENPTPGSKNLVESGGVDEKISYHGFNDLTTAEADLVGVSSNGSIVDQITRKISTAPANNRVLIGPFHFTHDTEITIDDGYRYIIYYLFPDDTTAYSQMYNTWQTGKHIIGVHPKYKDEIMYYIMLSKTDNGAMTNLLAYEYKKIIHLKNVDGENPLHLIFCDSWTADATPKGNNSISPAMYQRLWGEKEAEKNMYCYFGNNTLVFSAYNNGQEFLSNIHRPFILPQKGNTKFLIRKNETYNTEFRDCTSFSQLYSIINFNKEYFDFKRIEGNNIFAGAQALTAGNNFLTNLSDGLVIQGENIGYSHVPSLKFYDSKAYVTMQTDTSGQEGSSNTTILISEIDVSNNQIVNNYIVAGLGTYGGVTFDGGCNNPYSYIVGSTLHIIYNAHINGGLYLAHCAFNLNSKEFTNEICSIEHNSETKDFNDANIHSLFGAETGIKGYDPEFVASQIATDGTYYYVTISSGNFEDGKTPIMFTSDFSIWKLFVVPDMEYGSDCEIAIAISGGYLYGASRHYYRDCTLCIWKMDLSTKKVVDSVQINDCATRPTFYVKSGEVFLVHGLDSRKCLQIIWIYKNMLAQSSCYLECQDERILGYNSFEYDGTYTYIAIQRGISGISTPRNVFAKLTVI